MKCLQFFTIVAFQINTPTGTALFRAGKHHNSAEKKRITVKNEDHAGILVSIDNMMINKEHKVRWIFPCHNLTSDN